ncbi:calcium-binding protein [Salipiger abyssi]|uniref:calcium-binding protein n=1 Tax=Salipiger abyssi TaxID=1250539 RepID=UPI004058414E
MEWFLVLMASLVGAAVIDFSGSSDDDEDDDTPREDDVIDDTPEASDDDPDDPAETPDDPEDPGDMPEDPVAEDPAATYGDSFQLAELDDGTSVLVGTDGDDTLTDYWDLTPDELAGNAASLLGGDGNDDIDIHDNGSLLRPVGLREFTADGQAGDDTLRAISYESGIILRGGEGDDTLIGVAVTLYGDDGDDYLESTPFNGEEFGIQTVEGGAGNDVINALEGFADIDGGTGDDYVATGHHSTVSGGDGEDYFRVLERDNTIDGGDGNDTIWADLDLGPRETPYPTIGGNIYETETDYEIALTGGDGEDVFDMWLSLDHVDSENDEPMVVARITDFDPAEDMLLLNLDVNSVTQGGLAQDYDHLLSLGYVDGIGAPTRNESLEVSSIEVGPDDAYTDIVLSGTGSTLEGTYTREFILRVEGVALGEDDFAVTVQ